MDSNLCPTCIEELEPQQKKLGRAFEWLVCPSCGYREANDEKPVNIMLEVFYDDSAENFEDIVRECNEQDGDLLRNGNQ